MACKLSDISASAPIDTAGRRQYIQWTRRPLLPTGPYAAEILAGIDRVDTTLSFDVKPANGPARAPVSIYMSEAGDCARKVGYRLLRYDQPPRKLGTGATFAAGNFYEALIVAGLNQAGFPVTAAQDAHRPDDPPLSGKIDGDVELPAPHGLCLLEVKSANSYTFSELPKSDVRTVYPTHFAQMQLYMHYRERPLGLYVNICKNFADIYTALLPYDAEYVERLLTKLRSVWAMTRAGELPPPDYHKSSRTCNYCPYASLCPGKQATGGKMRVIIRR